VWSPQQIPTAVNLSYLDRNLYFFIQLALLLSSRGWLDPVPEALRVRESGSIRNRTWNLWICIQELWPRPQRRFIIFLPITFENTNIRYKYIFWRGLLVILQPTWEDCLHFLGTPHVPGHSLEHGWKFVARQMARVTFEAPYWLSDECQAKTWTARSA
jgi:hypothetical protein